MGMGVPCQDKSFFCSLLGLSPGHWQEGLSARPRGVLACDLSPYPCCLSICPCSLSSIPVVCPSVPAAAVEVHDDLSGDWWLCPVCSSCGGDAGLDLSFPCWHRDWLRGQCPCCRVRGCLHRPASVSPWCLQALDLWRIISDNLGPPQCCSGAGTS